MNKCKECKNFGYGIIGKGAGYKCYLKNKPRSYTYKTDCKKFERK